MPTVLITGANRGLGLEFVEQYACDDWGVIACCRAPGKADALQALAQTHAHIRIEALDVVNDKSIKTLADRLKDTPIDILINNAGIFSGVGIDGSHFPSDTSDTSQNFGSIDSLAWEKVLRVNTIAPLMMIESFLPHLQKGNSKKIINITSRMGSLTELEKKSGSLAYRSSKTALNSAMRTIASDLSNLGLIIINIHPGWVKTDMGGAHANMTPQQSITHLRQTIAALKPENSGQFMNYDGSIIPW